MSQTLIDSPHRTLAVKRRLPTLDDIRVATPCHQSWDGMRGNGRVRRCDRCEKQVFNLSNMPRADAEALLEDHVDGLCVRFYRRFDGTILTADCPVGVRLRTKARVMWGMTMTAAIGFLALLGVRSLGTPVYCRVHTATTGFSGPEPH
jgi:hypothetical protein